MPKTPSQAIFIWIPRNGGTSIHTRVCESPRERTSIGWTYERRGCRFSMIGHRSLREVANAKMLEGDPFTFAFVRNPWDRMVSLYHYWTRRKLFVGAGFVDFVTAVIDRPELTPIRKCKLHHASPQFEWLRRKDEIGVEYVGRFEHLQDSWREASARLGWHDEQPLSQQNGTSHRDYHDYYNDATIEKVRRFYRRDIEQWKYTYN